MVQTRKAESSLDALREIVRAIRQIHTRRDESTHTGKGTRKSIVQLDAGDYVLAGGRAGGRLIASESLKVNEGMLTGESEAARKNTDLFTGEAPIGDRLNMVHSGSLVVNGPGTFVVTGTAKEAA